MPTLNWHKREEAVRAATRAPYRLLEPVPELSYGDADSENLLIQGDNLDALKALLPYYAGRVKCIAIDPPYNTRSAFQHYDDNLEHSTWLSLMYPRLELLRDLLAEDGSIWVCIDDNEAHYLKVIMDEVFGRKNFVANVVWQKRTSPDARIHLGPAHDNILVYSPCPDRLKLNKLKLTQTREATFKNADNDARGVWSSTDFTAQGWRPNQMYKITTPAGVVYEPPGGRCWANVEGEFEKLQADGRIWFGKQGKSRPRVKNFLSETEGISSWTWWPHLDAGHNQEAKKEIIDLFGTDRAFDTPKPERLFERVLRIATNPGDLVLDSFLGSATTAAVAHKMGRRWIGIELGDHAVTHCVPRLKKVVEGELGGISEAVGWKGGGGFRFCRLGPDESTNSIRSVSGSGISLAFDWDGTGAGGASIPDGLYNYFISAQTNGQSFAGDSGSGSGGDGGGTPPAPDSSTSIGTASLADSWYPTSAKLARAAGWSFFYVEPPPMPPVVVRTNGVQLSIPWEDLYGPQPLLETPVPLRAQTRAAQVFSTPDSPSPDGPVSYSGPSSESTTAPARAAAVGVKNSKGNYGVGYYSYPNTNTFNVPNNGMYPDPQPMHLESSLSSRTCYPAPDSDNLAVEFMQAMRKKGWTLAFPQARNGDLSANSVRRSDQGYNGGEIFTQGTIGLFMAHGNFGSDPDYSKGANGGLQTYFPSCNPNDGSNPWIRLCQLGFGGNLKWMAILACNSLCDPNWQDMKKNGGIPLKTTHLLCGAASITYMAENVGAYWANNMLSKKSPQTIANAWFNAAKTQYHEPLTTPIPGTVIFRVTGYPECMSDTVESNTPPTNPKSNPTNLAKQDSQVYP